MTLTATAQPKIYVACLAAYTNGKLYGAWINADQDAEDIEAEVKEMLKQSTVLKASMEFASANMKA